MTVIITNELIIVTLSQKQCRGTLHSEGGHKPGKTSKLGILGEFCEPGKLMEFSGNFVQPQGKIITNKIIVVKSNICVKQLLAG